MAKKFPLSKSLVIILTALVLFLGYLIYSSKEPFVKPLFIEQINPRCPYYKDFLGSIYFRYSYYPSSFLIIGQTERKMYYYWHKIKDVTSKNFKIEKVLPEKRVDLGLETQKVCLASAGDNLIYDNDVFPAADAESFEKLDNSFYRDRNTVYYSNGKVVPGADPQTFEALITDKCPNSHPPFAQDKFNVFYANNVIEQADRETFELVCVKSGVRGKDKNHVYLDFRVEN